MKDSKLTFSRQLVVPKVAELGIFDSQVKAPLRSNNLIYRDKLASKYYLRQENPFKLRILFKAEVHAIIMK